MKILIVAHSKEGKFAPFVTEQAEALRAAGVEVRYFGVTGRGARGYLKNLPFLNQAINEYHPDIVHAHYGLSGLLANLQRRVPVVTTYHGSDINYKSLRPFSLLSIWLSKWNIFVSKRLFQILNPRQKWSIIPCGVNLDAEQLFDSRNVRQEMQLSLTKKYLLFAGSYDNLEKNVSLAQSALSNLKDENIEMLELKGYSRLEVNKLMCAVDALLLTSHSEGSPQVVKEAMACGLPIVSVDVGDVKERVAGVDGCYISLTRSPQELSELLRKALSFRGRTNGRNKIIEDGLENVSVAKVLINIYNNVNYVWNSRNSKH